MVKHADLSPPLGLYGGPCKVVERIEDKVRSPSLRDDLAEKVEHGVKLTNPEAAKIYSIEAERGGGIFSKMRITPHAQYRMDQRGVTVGDLRVSLNHFSRKLNDWKSQQSWEYKHYSELIARSEPVEWVDQKLGDLVVVFTGFGRGVANIITTYWKGEADPAPGTCGTHPRHARTVEDMSGYRTMVKNPSPGKSDTGDGKYRDRGLPSPPWSKSKPLGPQRFNVPGESGSNSDGNVHKDKARTKGTPGERATHPNEPARIAPTRRPGMTAGDWDLDFLDEMDPALAAAAVRMAGMYPPNYPGANRQREQKGRAYQYFHKRYRKNRGRILQQQKRRHKRLKPNGRYQADRERRRKSPDRFERRPGGGAKSIAERSRDQRKEQKRKEKKAFEPVPFYHYLTGEWGVVVEVSTLGMVHIDMEDGRRVVPFDTFFDEAVIDEDRLDDLFAYLDEVFEYLSEGDGDSGGDDDPLFDEWFDGHVPAMTLTAYTVKYRPDVRRRRQKGRDKLRARMWYQRNRARARLRSRKRYKRVKKHPAFKKQQQIRRKHPARFKMRLGEVLTAPEIAFTLIRNHDMVLGYVRNVSGMTGLVSFWLKEKGHQFLRTMPVRDFILKAVFLSDEDIEAFYNLVDAEVGVEAYDLPDDLDTDLVNLFTIESVFMHDDEDGELVSNADHLLIDPTDDDFYYGAVNRLASRVLGTFFREQRPPEMDSETVYDRANDHDKRKRRDREPGGDLYTRWDDEVKDSNPGSRVLPSGKGHVEKEAALIRDIREGCDPDLLERAGGVKVRLSRVDQRNAVWLFDVQGSKEAYRVRLKALRKGNVRDLQKTHVRVSCSCPFWQWQGPEFHAKQGDYLYGKPRGTASRPEVKDPGNSHRACKHVLAVLGHVTSRAWSVPNQKRASDLHYLADTLRDAEVVHVFDEFERRSRRVAARYLATLEVQDA